MYFSLLEKYNITTTELSKYKDRDALQMTELVELRQSSALLERVCTIFLSFFHRKFP
jgi:hypothetical protein